MCKFCMYSKVIHLYTMYLFIFKFFSHTGYQTVLSVVPVLHSGPCGLVYVQVCVPSHVGLCNPVDHSPPGSSVHGILQARILELIAISSSRGSSQPRGQTHISCIPCIGR